MLSLLAVIHFRADICIESPFIGSKLRASIQRRLDYARQAMAYHPGELRHHFEAVRIAWLNALTPTNRTGIELEGLQLGSLRLLQRAFRKLARQQVVLLTSRYENYRQRR